MESPNKEKEIHKTEFIDKVLPTVYFNKAVRKSMSETEEVTISVSDKTSVAALNTFKELTRIVKEQ